MFFKLKASRLTEGAYSPWRKPGALRAGQARTALRLEACGVQTVVLVGDIGGSSDDLYVAFGSVTAWGLYRRQKVPLTKIRTSTEAAEWIFREMNVFKLLGQTFP